MLTYHRIGDGSGSALDRALWSATTDQLDRHLTFLVRNFDVITPDELAGAVERPGRRVLVTFDDGYRDLYTHAFPVLEAHRVTATMFLCSGFLDGRASAWWDEIAWMLRSASHRQLDPGPWAGEPLTLSAPDIELSIERVNAAYRTLDQQAAAGFLGALADATGSGRRPPDETDWITWEMAREMRAAGHEIGAHTVHHPLLSRLSPDRQRAEIVGSLDRIEAEIGERPRWFGYPVGQADSFTADTADRVREAGVDLAFANHGGYVHQAWLRPYNVPRSNMGPVLDGPTFRAVVTLPQLCAR